MKQILFLVLLVVCACREERPPAPTAEQNQQLNEADAMLNELGNEEEAPNR